MIDDWSNATFERIRQIALWRKDDWIEIRIRSDGRVTFVGESGPDTNWRVEADLLQSSVLPPPNKVMHDLEKQVNVHYT